MIVNISFPKDYPLPGVASLPPRPDDPQKLGDLIFEEHRKCNPSEQNRRALKLLGMGRRFYKDTASRTLLHHHEASVAAVRATARAFHPICTGGITASPVHYFTFTGFPKERAPGNSHQIIWGEKGTDPVAAVKKALMSIAPDLTFKIEVTFDNYKWWAGSDTCVSSLKVKAELLDPTDLSGMHRTFVSWPGPSAHPHPLLTTNDKGAISTVDKVMPISWPDKNGYAGKPSEEQKRCNTRLVVKVDLIPGCPKPIMDLPMTDRYAWQHFRVMNMMPDLPSSPSIMGMTLIQLTTLSHNPTHIYRIKFCLNDLVLCHMHEVATTKYLELLEKDGTTFAAWAANMLDMARGMEKELGPSLVHDLEGSLDGFNSATSAAARARATTVEAEAAQKARQAEWVETNQKHDENVEGMEETLSNVTEASAAADDALKESREVEEDMIKDLKSSRWELVLLLITTTLTPLSCLHPTTTNYQNNFALHTISHLPTHQHRLQLAKSIILMILSGKLGGHVPWKYYEEALATDPALRTLSFDGNVEVQRWGGVTLKMTNREAHTALVTALQGGAITFMREGHYRGRMYATKAVANSREYVVWIRGFSSQHLAHLSDLLKSVESYATHPNSLYGTASKGKGGPIFLSHSASATAHPINDIAASAIPEFFVNQHFEPLSTTSSLGEEGIIGLLLGSNKSKAILLTVADAKIRVVDRVANQTICFVGVSADKDTDKATKRKDALLQAYAAAIGVTNWRDKAMHLDLYSASLKAMEQLKVSSPEAAAKATQTVVGGTILAMIEKHTTPASTCDTMETFGLDGVDDWTAFAALPTTPESDSPSEEPSSEVKRQTLLRAFFADNDDDNTEPEPQEVQMEDYETTGRAAIQGIDPPAPAPRGSTRANLLHSLEVNTRLVDDNNWLSPHYLSLQPYKYSLIFLHNSLPRLRATTIGQTSPMRKWLRLLWPIRQMRGKRGQGLQTIAIDSTQGPDSLNYILTLECTPLVALYVPLLPSLCFECFQYGVSPHTLVPSMICNMNENPHSIPSRIPPYPTLNLSPTTCGRSHAYHRPTNTSTTSPPNQYLLWEYMSWKSTAPRTTEICGWGGSSQHGFIPSVSPRNMTMHALNIQILSLPTNHLHAATHVSHHHMHNNYVTRHGRNLPTTPTTRHAKEGQTSTESTSPLQMRCKSRCDLLHHHPSDTCGKLGDSWLSADLPECTDLSLIEKRGSRPSFRTKIMLIGEILSTGRPF